ncbi:YwmB family TATA-box binding protein [Paenibacillus gorillae]|uniref:YwmB family TATA-box binding protein n=1 Tax=Paenibacillus gorillae TaxID=1243662 RepID=UPI0004B6CE0C|nr:YwmB family TATA-box binding protein [Paenibacillus gorillae]
MDKYPIKDVIKQIERMIGEMMCREADPISTSYYSIRTIKNRKRQQMHARLAVLAAIVVLVACGWWAFMQKGSDTAKQSAFQHDIQSLWSWTDKLFKDGAGAAEWSLRWDVEGDGATVGELVQAMTSVIISEGADEATVMLEAYGGELSIHSLPAGRQKRAILQFRTSGKASKQSLLDLVYKVEAVLKSAGTKYTEGITVRGKTEYNDAIHRLEKAGQAREVEHYADGGTVSNSYYTDRLQKSVQSGGKEGRLISFQAAVHREAGSKQHDLIVGLPLITGDYANSAP